jgi:hypothetical protein
MLICAVIHFSDDLVKVNDQVSNPQNGLAPFPVYSSQRIVGWNTHFLGNVGTFNCANSVRGFSLDACDVIQRVTSY